MPNWAVLDQSLGGGVVLPGSTGYDRVRKPFVAGFTEPRPRAVVLAAAAEDIVEAIGFARRHRLGLAVRSGGHCMAGYSSTDGVLIDVGALHGIALDGGVLRLGAGVKLGQLTAGLAPHGVTIPAGTCPSVGVSGLTLGGGFGVLSRLHGLTSDHLLAATVVLADGRVVTCDRERESDLFWALRGAGWGNFGVVTELVFGTVPAPRMTNFQLVWRLEHAAEVARAWQDWAPAAPDEMFAELHLSAGDGTPAAVAVQGAAAMPRSAATTLLESVTGRVAASPTTDVVAELSYPETARFQAFEDDDDVPDQPPRSRFTRSEFFRVPLPAEAVGQLVQTFVHDDPPGQHREVMWAPWGGAIGRVPPGDTAFVHRAERTLLEHLVQLDPEMTDAERQRGRRWVNRSWGAAHPWGSGRVYQNFPDPHLPDWSPAYYGENLDRLRRIKAAYDPDGVFGAGRHAPPDVP